MTRRVLGFLVPASLVAGVVLMVAFDAAVTRVLGIGCLLGFVAGGLYLIAEPGFLARDE